MNAKTLVSGLMLTLAGFSLTAEKVAAQTSAAAKPICHAIDSVGIGNGRGLKLYVAGTDNKTFNRIFGFLYNPSAELSTGKTKVPVDVIIYDPKYNRMSIIPRGGDVRGGEDLTPSPKIEAYLEGKGTNANGEPIAMAADSNIEIVNSTASTTTAVASTSASALKMGEWVTFDDGYTKLMILLEPSKNDPKKLEKISAMMGDSGKNGKVLLIGEVVAYNDGPTKGQYYTIKGLATETGNENAQFVVPLGGGISCLQSFRYVEAALNTYGITRETIKNGGFRISFN